MDQKGFIFPGVIAILKILYDACENTNLVFADLLAVYCLSGRREEGVRKKK
jgi:hypothetical protein